MPHSASLAEVAAWEARYEERVQEEMDKYHEAELSLRARVRHLEDETETARHRNLELEAELQSMKLNAEAVESANVNLEKRLEILSIMTRNHRGKFPLLYPDRNGYSYC